MKKTRSNEKGDNEYDLCGIAIHKHLGHLAVSDFMKDNFPIYFAVTPGRSDGLEFIGRKPDYGSEVLKYKILHTFPDFQTETLAALAFFDKMSYDNTFVTKDGKEM